MGGVTDGGTMQERYVFRGILTVSEGRIGKKSRNDYLCSMGLEAKINDKTYGLGIIPGSWPLEKGDTVDIYCRPDEPDSYQPILTKKVSKEDMLKRDNLKPVRIEKKNEREETIFSLNIPR